MFDRIAPTYDRTNRLMTFGLDNRWRRLTLRLLDVQPSDRVLDLGCGTGDFLGLAASSGATVTGLDFSGAMLAEAARRRDAAALVRGDARRLPVRTASLTVLVSGFTLRNFSPLEPALAEAGRVLAPGGRIGLLEVDAPSNAVLRLGHRLYFRGDGAAARRRTLGRPRRVPLPAGLGELPARATRTRADAPALGLSPHTKAPARARSGATGYSGEAPGLSGSGVSSVSPVG